MSLALALVAVLLQSPTPSELRDAMNALRDGHPGDAQFEAALPRLPDLLASDAAAFVEGGAHLVGVHRRLECVPALVAALERENARPPQAWCETARHILGALIRLDAAAPQGALLARPDERLANELYLALACEKDAAKRADGFAKLVEQGWTTTQAHWAALCRLTALDDPRAASWLVSGAPWEFGFAVREPDSEYEGFSRSACGLLRTSHGTWPPRVRFELALPGPADALDSIRSYRREGARSVPLPRAIDARERVELRWRMLQKLAQPDASLAQPPYVTYSTSTDRAELSGELGACVDALRGRVRSAADVLAARQLIGDPAAACAQLKFRAELLDLRADRERPLAWPASLPGIERVVRR